MGEAGLEAGGLILLGADAGLGGAATAVLQTWQDGGAGLKLTLRAGRS